MVEIPVRHEVYDINIEGIPHIVRANFTACRANQSEYCFDCINFEEKFIDRWLIKKITVDKAIEKMAKSLPLEKLPFNIRSYEQFAASQLFCAHVAHFYDNKLIVCFGNVFNGLFLLIIDTAKTQAFIYPGDYAAKLMCYTGTGDFMQYANEFLFARWAWDDTVSILNNKKNKAHIEVCTINLKTLCDKVIYEFDHDDRIHQITSSEDGRYIVFTHFQLELKKPYPYATIDEAPEAYRKCHESGFKRVEMVTVDLERGVHWKTEVPSPVPGHFEFDPDPMNHDTFYVSAHNISLNNNDMIIEGPGAILKIRIGECENVFEGIYSDEEFFRITQHMPFIHKGKTLIAVTNLPNKLDFIDAKNMTLWRRVELFEALPIDFSKSGNAVCPKYSSSCYSINPSSDGKYIVLESGVEFLIYDIDNDCILPNKISRNIPEGFFGTGHTRLYGY